MCIRGVFIETPVFDSHDFEFFISSPRLHNPFHISTLSTTVNREKPARARETAVKKIPFLRGEKSRKEKKNIEREEIHCATKISILPLSLSLSFEPPSRISPRPPLINHKTLSNERDTSFERNGLTVETGSPVLHFSRIFR